ncbi:MAG: imidazole glycerol phosphate synthase subunit HisH [bacterium]|nr:imidazole glycerol phosphate synthase subunit HisH [bacterium]
MVAIIDYGLGNIRSVAAAVARVGFVPIVTADPAELQRAEALILPGVGAFGDGMANLRTRNLVEPLTDLILHQQKPILGVCLGAQLFARSSEEFGHHEGLGWIAADVVRLAPPDGLRVPHVGWNDCIRTQQSPLFDGIPTDALFYYVHSFHIRCDDSTIVVGECEYGSRFTAAFQQKNIVATQFHPEKSQQHGLQFLKNFLLQMPARSYVA